MEILMAYRTGRTAYHSNDRKAPKYSDFKSNARHKVLGNFKRKSPAASEELVH